MIGVWTGKAPHLSTRKNDFYHTVDLTTTVPPVAMDLLPMLHAGLKELYKDYTPR